MSGMIIEPMKISVTEKMGRRHVCCFLIQKCIEVIMLAYTSV